MERDFGEKRGENWKISAKTEKPRPELFLKGSQIE